MLDWVDNGFNCETNSWQTRRLLNPLSLPESRLCPSLMFQQMFLPGLLSFGGKKKCPSILSVAYICCPGTVFESLYASGWRTENDRLWELLCWMVGDSPSSNKLLSTGEAGWSGLPPHTLQYSKTAHRINTGLLSGYVLFFVCCCCFFLIYLPVFLSFLFFFPFLFPFLSFHIYSWRIFKLFSKNMLANEFLRLTNSCFFGIF